MEPMAPSENQSELNDLAVELVAQSNSFAGMLHPVVAKSIGVLVRSMNCYYSNLIEEHDTHPKDIDRVFSTTNRILFSSLFFKTLFYGFTSETLKARSSL